MMRRISSLTLLFGLLALGTAFADNVYRWVDDEGKVHFTPTLPPEVAHKPYDIYSPNGMLIERVTDPMKQLREQQQAAVEAKAYGPKKPAPLYTEEQKKALGDRLLLLKYRTEDELLEAMNLEVDHLKYDARILESSHQSLMNSLAGQISIAAGRQRSGLEIEQKQREEIDVLRRRLRNSRVELDRMAQRKETIRTEFEKELQHYRTLVASNEGESAGD
jgi:hypothetical protein